MRFLLGVLALSALVVAHDEVAQEEVAPRVERIFVIMFENHGYKLVLSDPGWRQIVSKGMLLTNYKGVTHPSQPNYIAQLGADTLGCKDDADFNTRETGLIDTLNHKGISWKNYQENYTPKAGGDCNMITSNGKYYRKHNPHMSFQAITSNHSECQKIVNDAELAKDIAANKFAQFMYYTPNIDNDSHNQPLPFSANYFKGWMDKHMAPGSHFLNNTLIFLTWDEDDHTEGNHVIGLMFGSYVKPGTQDDGTDYSHYSIAKTVQENWGTASLGRNDVKANSLLHALKPGVARPLDLDKEFPLPTSD